MIRLDMPQGSEEWVQARLGIPTASMFDKLVTPSGKASKSAVPYAGKLLAEWFVGYPIETEAEIAAMERGKQLEPEARGCLEMVLDAEIDIVGICLRDDGEVACSPDGLIGEEEGAEIKCPLIHTHATHILDPDGFVADHKHQVQGGLYITGRKRWHLFSYNPVMPPVHIICERDEAYIKTLDAVIGPFVQQLREAKARLEPWRQRDDIPERRRTLVRAGA